MAYGLTFFIITLADIEPFFGVSLYMYVEVLPFNLWGYSDCFSNIQFLAHLH